MFHVKHGVKQLPLCRHHELKQHQLLKRAGGPIAEQCYFSMFANASEKNMRMKSLLLGAVVALSLAAPAVATECYVGGGGAYATALSDTSLDVSGFGSVVAVDSFAADGEGLFGTVGCDFKVPSTQLFVGAFADFTWLNDAGFSITSSLAPAAIVEAELEHAWSIGVRVGTKPVAGASVYVLAGYTQADLSDISSPAFSASLSTPTLKGYVIGAGTEIDLRGGFAFQAQYTFADYERESLDIGVPGAALGIDMDNHTVRGGIVYRFWDSPSPLK